MVMTITIMRIGGAAWAADLDSVEALIREGVELRHQGRDERALPLFQKAYSQARSPRSSGQLGLCEMAVGYWVDAEKHLVETLNVPEHPWVSKNLANLTGALAAVRRNVSDVVIDGGPAGAEVLVNGQVVGRLPLAAPVRLGKGAADVEVRASGYLSVSRSLKIGGGGTERVIVDLARGPATQVAQAAPVAAPPVVAAGSNEGGSVAQSLDGDVGTSHSNPRRIAAWSTGAAATLALGFGVIETFAWLSKLDQFDKHMAPIQDNPGKTYQDCGTTAVNYGGAACQAIHKDLVGARAMALVGYGLAGALGAVSAILFATSSDSSPKSSSSTAFACAPDLVARGLGCRIQF
jgi:hypothetical protein